MRPGCLWTAFFHCEYLGRCVADAVLVAQQRFDFALTKTERIEFCSHERTAVFTTAAVVENDLEVRDLPDFLP